MSQGTIVQCIGAVVDIQFPRDAMPKIYDALYPGRCWAGSRSSAEIGDGGRTVPLRWGLRTVCVVACSNTGSGISVPVGHGTLGRIMDVLGRPIDETGRSLWVTSVGSFTRRP